MLKRLTIMGLACICLVCAIAQSSEPLVFKKQKLNDLTYESACAADLNNDGKLDIVCGEYWYPGPRFTKSHKMCELLAERGYFDDFGVYPMDVNGDGYIDIVSGGWFGKTLTWRENPKGKPILWKIHEIEQVGSIERPCFWDVDGDGFVEVIPNLPKGPLVVFQLVRDAKGKGTGVFKRHEISPDFQGHGLGFGDINGDGRSDFIVAKGWYQAPAKPFKQSWTWHPEFELGRASVPMPVFDVDGDGKNDIIVGMGHDYGLAWWQQGKNQKWTKHDIETTRSQYHEMRLADLDNDGKPELVTGKRYYAHGGKDAGAEDPVGLYYFALQPGKSKGVTIDYGPPGKASGAGIYMWIADLDGNGFDDIVAPGKEGLYLFWNQGPAKAEHQHQH